LNPVSSFPAMFCFVVPAAIQLSLGLHLSLKENSILIKGETNTLEL
jgi:hypothetical protein